MKELRAGECIAERRLTFRESGGSKTRVVVKIGKPLVVPRPGRDWYCTFTIVGWETRETKSAFGIDSLQALTLALEMLTANLRYLERRKNGKLTWLGDAGLDLLPRQEASKKRRMVSRARATSHGR